MNSRSLLTALTVLSYRMGSVQGYDDAIQRLEKQNVIVRNKNTQQFPPNTAFLAKKTYDSYRSRTYLSTEEFSNGIVNFGRHDKRLGYTTRKTFCITKIDENLPLDQKTKKFPFLYTQLAYDKYWKIKYIRHKFETKKNRKRNIDQI